MRVLTFQSKEVLNVLENNDRYEINKYLCRESGEYNLELIRYKYFSPVWVFAPLGMNKRKLKDSNKFSKEDFIDAVKFMGFKCEMSLYDTLELNNFYLLE